MVLFSRYLLQIQSKEQFDDPHADPHVDLYDLRRPIYAPQRPGKLNMKSCPSGLIISTSNVIISGQPHEVPQRRKAVHLLNV